MVLFPSELSTPTLIVSIPGTPAVIAAVVCIQGQGLQEGYGLQEEAGTAWGRANGAWLPPSRLHHVPTPLPGPPQCHWSWWLQSQLYKRSRRLLLCSEQHHCVCRGGGGCSMGGCDKRQTAQIRPTPTLSTL